MIRVADYMMKRLKEEQISHLFYVPGGQCVYLMDALRRSELVGVGTHHEQAAAMAAISYSQYTENLGACLVTTGCAGTNTMTAVLHAWQDSIPIVFISGQQAVEQTTHASVLPLRQIGVQEADIVRLVEPITKYAVMLEEPTDIAYAMDVAFMAARSGRPGPVWLDIPLPVQNAMVAEEKLERFSPNRHGSKIAGGQCSTVQEVARGQQDDKKDLEFISSEEEGIKQKTEVRRIGEKMCISPAPELREKDVVYIRDALEHAQRPVIFAGHGVRSAGAVESLRNFAERYQLPVVFTRFSMDILEYAHPCNMGVVCSVSANRYANFIIQNADLVLCIGCRLSIDTTGPAQEQFARAAVKIVVDIDAIEHSKQGVPIDRLVVADARDALEKLNDSDIRINEERIRNWMETCRHWKEIFPAYEPEAREKDPLDFKFFLDELQVAKPTPVTYLADAGFTGAIVPANCRLQSGDRMIHAYAQGEMGFVLPGAFGAACAAPESTVVAISGDGSIMMNLQELQTLVRNHFNIKLIINNNNGYSGVRHGQKAHFRGKSIGTDPSNGLDFPDFSKVADAFGIPYIRIGKPAEIREKLKDMFEETGPCICEVFSDPDQYDLHNALVMYGKRKFGFRPIEDQSPFLDRETFFSEMIIEPMETSYGKPV